MTKKTEETRPGPALRVVEKTHAPNTVDEAPSEEVTGLFSEPITALVPPEIKAAVDALVRVHIGTGTITDLAEIALTIHEGGTKFHRGWFLDAVTESLKDLQQGVSEAAQCGRWNEAAMLKAQQNATFQRMRAFLARSTDGQPTPPGSGSGCA